MCTLQDSIRYANAKSNRFFYGSELFIYGLFDLRGSCKDVVKCKKVSFATYIFDSEINGYLGFLALTLLTLKMTNNHDISELNPKLLKIISADRLFLTQEMTGKCAQFTSLSTQSS